MSKWSNLDPAAPSVDSLRRALGMVRAGVSRSPIRPHVAVVPPGQDGVIPRAMHEKGIDGAVPFWEDLAKDAAEIDSAE